MANTAPYVKLIKAELAYTTAQIKYLLESGWTRAGFYDDGTTIWQSPDGRTYAQRYAVLIQRRAHEHRISLREASIYVLRAR